LPGKVAAANWPLYQFLLNKWYFDEIFDFLFVRPARNLGRLLWKYGDGATIDGGINGLAMGIIPFFTRLAGRAQSGYLFHYAFAMVLGIAVLLTLMTLTGGAESAQCQMGGAGRDRADVPAVSVSLRGLRSVEHRLPVRGGPRLDPRAPVQAGR